MATKPDQSPASTGSDDGGILDNLFDAIRDQQPARVRQILEEHPRLVNCFNQIPRANPQELFENGRFEYSLTQDILRRNLGDEIVVTESCRQMPLHLACIIGDMETKTVLLERMKEQHIGLELKNESGETAFSIACRSGNLHTAKLLLDNGFKLSPEMMNDEWHSPLDYLIYRGICPEWSQNPPEKQCEVLEELTIQMMNTFKDDEPKHQLLRFVVAEGNLPMFEAVLKGWCGVCDVDTPDEQGWTLLHLAAAEGHVELVERLLNRDANPEAHTEQPARMNAGEIAMESLHDSETAQTISTMVMAAQLIKQSKRNGDEHSECACWRWLSHDPQQKRRQQRKVQQTTLKRLISDYGTKDKPLNQGETLWCHFHANKEQWIKDLCRSCFDHDIAKGGEYLGFLQNTFDFANEIPLNRHRLAEALFRTKNKNNNIALVIPMMDIDILEPGFTDTFNSSKAPARLTKVKFLTIDEKHVVRMQDFHSSSKTGLHPARTLDNYADADLCGKPLERYNSDQVLSRWFDNHHGHKSHIRPHNSNEAHGRATNLATRLLKAFPRATRATGGLSLTAGTSALDVESQTDSVPETRFNRLILVVSQLWLFKFDDILVTSYPERWDSSSDNHQFSERLRNMVEKRPRQQRFQSELLLHKIVEESMKFQANIPSNLLEINQSSSAAAQKQVEPASYLQIFGKEVMRIWREVDEIYQEFKNGLGQADEKFAEYTVRSTECLLNLDDVLDEIGTIKGVLKYQLSIWNELHIAYEAPAEDLSSNTTSSAGDAKRLREPRPGKCVWDPGCDPVRSRESFFKHGVFSLADKIEQDAKMLRDKTKTLTELLYGQAGTENAIKSYELGRNLAVFTWVTVIFTPLSFITALFALQIESFSPNQGAWTAWQVGTGSGVSVLVTLIVSIGWVLNQKKRSGSVQPGLHSLKESVTGDTKIATSEEQPKFMQK